MAQAEDEEPQIGGAVQAVLPRRVADNQGGKAGRLVNDELPRRLPEQIGLFQLQGLGQALQKSGIGVGDDPAAARRATRPTAIAGQNIL